MLRRVVIPFLLAAGLVGPLASPASADQPTIQWLTDPISFVLPAGQFCAGFDAQVDIEQKAKIITFTDGGAAFAGVGTGKIFATVTNLSTGHSIRLDISGPAFFDATGLPYLGTGTWLIYIPGDPGSILYLVGRMNFIPEPYGIAPSLVRGRSMDMCLAL